MADIRSEARPVRAEIPGHRLVQHVRQLIADGNARAVRITTPDGALFLEMALTPVAFTGGLVVLAAPWLAVLATVAAAVAQVNVEIVDSPRHDAAAPPPSPEPATPAPVAPAPGNTP